MRFSRVRVVPVGLFALATATIIAVQSPAQAAPVTATTITSPANGTHYMIKNSSPGKPVTVTGTSNGTTGDLVDIRCYELGSHTWQTGAENVPVQVDGSFSTTMDSDDPYGRCRLRAVPDNHPKGASLAGFNGPTVTTEYVLSDTIASGPNAGKVYDYYIEFQGKRALNDFASATGPGLWDSRLAFADGSSSNYLWYGNAALRGADDGRFRLKIDGRAAYGPRSAETAFPNNVGLPRLTFSVVRDAKTGVVTIKESNPIVLCPKGAPYPPTAETCPKYVPSGMRLDRSIIIKDGGLQVHIRDVWRSTDGKSHYVSPFFYQSVQGSDGATSTDTQVGLKVPWVGKYTTFGGEVNYTKPTSLPASIFVRDSNSAANGNSLFPRGALTFDFPMVLNWNANDEFTLRASTFKVPGGGVRVTHQSFVIGTTDAGVAAKAEASEDRQRPPVMAIAIS